MYTEELYRIVYFSFSDAVRITSSTTMNNASSRSHALFTIIFESDSIVDGNKVSRCGKMNFVDLAGSERLYKAFPSTT
jgi:hypothetical protein